MAQPFEILILDDEHDAADMMAEVLSLHLPQAAFRVAYTGEDAVQRGIAHRPGAAIFDLEMAGLGEEGAAMALRAASQGSLLLIALSGSVSRLAELRKKGPSNHLLSKPVDVAQVVELLCGCIRGGQFAGDDRRT